MADGRTVRVHSIEDVERPITWKRIDRRSGERSDSKDRNPHIRDVENVEESSVREPRCTGMVGAALQQHSIRIEQAQMNEHRSIDEQANASDEWLHRLDRR